MKVVLDTNIVVSGLLSSLGKPSQILTLVLSGAVSICHSPDILSEYAEVLARPRFQFNPDLVRDILDKIRTDGLSVECSSDELGLPDADDEPFLAVALAGAADFLITGNIAHFPSDKRRGCKVVTPAEFMSFWHET